MHGGVVAVGIVTQLTSSSVKKSAGRVSASKVCGLLEYDRANTRNRNALLDGHGHGPVDARGDDASLVGGLPQSRDTNIAPIPIPLRFPERVRRVVRKMPCCAGQTPVINVVWLGKVTVGTTPDTPVA